MDTVSDLPKTTHMCGVDIADQLWGISYSTLNRIHKWWHKIFFFLLDMIVVNTFIIYLAECKRPSKKPISHLQFRVKLCEALLQQWPPQEN
jgi:hypothetical protein